MTDSELLPLLELVGAGPTFRFESSQHRTRISDIPGLRCDGRYRPVPTLSPKAGQKGWGHRKSTFASWLNADG
jgi:hypothetical protein